MTALVFVSVAPAQSALVANCVRLGTKLCSLMIMAVVAARAQFRATSIGEAR